VTELGGYDFCPFDFYLQSVLKIRQPVGPQLSFGSVLHRAFERYYKSRLAAGEATAAELHPLVDELWSNRGYERKELAEADRQLAHATLDRFLEREARLRRDVTGSEVGIRFEIPEARLRIRGKIDALSNVTGGAEIRDFKTGRTKTDAGKLAKEAKDNFQLRTYALAYETMNSKLPAQVALDYVVTGVEGVAEMTPTIIRNHRAKLVAIAGKIRAREFAANPSRVHQCAAIKFYGTGEYDELAQELLTR
jgi:RecB family exonuclease